MAQVLEAAKLTAAEQRALYEEQGYLVVPSVLTRAELSDLRSALAEVLQRAEGLTADSPELMLARGFDGRFHVKRVRDPIAQHRAFSALVRHSGILDLVENLIGPDIQLQQTRLNLKPRAPDSWFDWHQDYAVFPHTNFDFLVVMVYLDDSTPDNGCLTVIPGSHKLGPLPHWFRFEGAPHTQLADRRHVEDRSRWLMTPVPAGGVEIHHGNLLHSSGVNESDRPRSALLLWYRSSDNVQVGGSTNFAGWGLQVRGVDRGIVRMVETTCKLPGAASRPRLVTS